MSKNVHSIVKGPLAVCSQMVHVIHASVVNGEISVKNHVETVPTARANKTKAIVIHRNVKMVFGDINVTDNAIVPVLATHVQLLMEVVMNVLLESGVLDVKPNVL